MAHHRPRSTLILGSQEENARIRELQQENIELQTSVAEYQSALELIMAKYREQVRILLNIYSKNLNTASQSDWLALTDKHWPHFKYDAPVFERNKYKNKYNKMNRHLQWHIHGVSRSNWNFIEMLVLWREEDWRTLQKTIGAGRRTNNK